MEFIALSDQIASAHGSLARQLPTARHINIDLETDSYGNGGPAEMVWGVCIEFDNGRCFNVTGATLGDAVVAASLEGSRLLGPQGLARAVQCGKLGGLGTSRIEQE